MSHRDDVMEQAMTKPARTMTSGVTNADACSARALGLSLRHMSNYDSEGWLSVRNAKKNAEVWLLNCQYLSTAPPPPKPALRCIFNGI